jgi:HEAT repeat protein
MSCRITEYDNIITVGRSEFYDSPLPHPLKIDALQDHDIQLFLQNRLDGAKFRVLWELIENDTDLKEIMCNPLILNLFAYTYDDETKTPAGLQQSNFSSARQHIIFDNYIEKRYIYEEKRLAPDPLYFGLDEIRDFLKQIAFALMSDEEPDDHEISSNLIRMIIPDEYQLNEFLTMTRMMHLVTSSEAGIDQFRFTHLQLRNHFAFSAASLAIRESETANRQKAALVLGKLKDIRALDDLVLALDDSEGIVRYEAAFALGQLTSNENQFDEILASLISSSNDSDIYVRKIIAQGLGNLPSDQSIDTLVKFLETPDEDRFVRQTAIVALGTISGSGKVKIEAIIEKATEPLVELWRNNPIKDVRNASIDIIEILYNKIKSSQARGIAREKAEMERALVRDSRLPQTKPFFGDTPPVQYFIDILSDYRVDIREHAAEMLGRLHAEASVNALIERLRDDEEHPDVRAKAIWALGEIGTPASEPAIPYILETLSYENKTNNRFIREASVIAIGKINPSPVLDRLNRSYRNDVIKDVREASERVLETVYHSQTENQTQ